MNKFHADILWAVVQHNNIYCTLCTVRTGRRYTVPFYPQHAVPNTSWYGTGTLYVPSGTVPCSTVRTAQFWVAYAADSDAADAFQYTVRIRNLSRDIWFCGYITRIFIYCFHAEVIFHFDRAHDFARRSISNNFRTLYDQSKTSSSSSGKAIICMVLIIWGSIRFLLFEYLGFLPYISVP